MKKIFYLFSLLFLLNGCVESIALLGSTAGGASSGKIVQSSLQQVVSYGIKKNTGKTPLGHALDYAEKNNPERKKETCISFIEKTRSEFCAVAKKKIALTNKAVKKKLATTVKKNSDPINSFMQNTKSPRQLAIAFQNDLKKRSKFLNKYLTRR